MHYYGFEGSVYIGNYAESHANEQSNTNILLIEVKYSTNRSLSKWLGSSCHMNLLCDNDSSTKRGSTKHSFTHSRLIHSARKFIPQFKIVTSKMTYIGKYTEKKRLRNLITVESHIRNDGHNDAQRRDNFHISLFYSI